MNKSKSKAQSQLEKDWPPGWSVTFADITTLLMSAFVLWYALTAAKYPPELLTIKRIEQMTAEDIERYLETLDKKTLPQKIVKQIKELTSQQKEAIDGAGIIQTLKKEIDKTIEHLGLKTLVKTQTTFQGVKITTQEPLLFKEGDFYIPSSKKELLKKILMPLIKSEKEFNIEISGYTDDKPINPYKKFLYRDNFELSVKRAESVARFLTKKLGIPAQNISITGYGPLKPIFPNISEEYRKLNRRVEIYIYIPPPTTINKVK